MIVTFPHAGSAWVPLKSLFDKNGITCIVPPKSSKRTLSLGVKHSPEWICLPYKMLLGNMLEGLELGADTVLDIGGPGLCRLGYYAKLHEAVLRDLGYDFQMVIFNWQEGGIVGLAKFIRSVLGPEKTWMEVLGDVKFGLQQLLLMDSLERRVHYLRPREKVKGSVSKIWRDAGDRVCAAHTPQELKKTNGELFGELDAIPLKPNANPLQVGFLGEFFMAIDPFCNMDLEEELGHRGVEVHRSAYLTEWCKVWLFLEAIGMSHAKKVKKAALPYLSRDVSGDAISSLGETVLHKQDGFDGIIHVMPFTCMPEIIAQNIFPKVVKDFDIPVLTLILDEQMGKAGMITRLEASVDLMARRRSGIKRMARTASVGVGTGG
ncbi:MAG: CoA protein activase [Dehalococcoidia bacterium]|nr:CoA protein activase [Dehalococcoidia bacterium]